MTEHCSHELTGTSPEMSRPRRDTLKALANEHNIKPTVANPGMHYVQYMHSRLSIKFTIYNPLTIQGGTYRKQAPNDPMYAMWYLFSIDIAPILIKLFVILKAKQS